MLFKELYIGIAMTFTVSMISCATDDYEQMDEEIAEEYDQEEVVQEDTEDAPVSESSTEMDSSNNSFSGDNSMETIMQEPVNEGSSEALAAELDKLSAPATTMEADSMVNTVAENPPSSPTEEYDTEEYGTTTSSDMPSTPPAPAQIDAEQAEYIVQPGDTLGRIAAVVYGSYGRWTELATDNGILDPGLIFPGDIVRYRVEDRSQNFRDAYSSVEQEVIMVQKGDTLTVIAERLFGRRDYWKPMWHLNRDLIPNPHQIKEGQILKYVDPKKMAQVLTEKGFSSYAH